MCSATASPRTRPVPARARSNSGSDPGARRGRIADVKITVLTGGVGGAKFLLGVKAFLGWDPTGPGSPDGLEADAITAVVNTGDDIRLHGLQVCPDLDSCLYTLSGVADTERGWGRKDETWTGAAVLGA